jgi:hypothetical protein
MSGRLGCSRTARLSQISTPSDTGRPGTGGLLETSDSRLSGLAGLHSEPETPPTAPVESR